MFSKKEYIFLAAILLIPLFPSYYLSGNISLRDLDLSNDPFAKRINEISMDEVLWLDARSKVKFDKRHIPGAILVNSKDWEGGLERLFEVFEPGQVMVVYCKKGCSSSRAVASRLRQELEQDNIYFLLGGIDSWLLSTDR